MMTNLPPHVQMAIGHKLRELLELCDALGALNNGGVFMLEMVVQKPGPNTVVLHDGCVHLTQVD